MYLYGYRQYQPHGFVNKLNYNNNILSVYLPDRLIYQPAPVVNGMGTFGIGKMGVHRAVVQFINPPTR